MTALLELLDRHPLATGWLGAASGLGASAMQMLEHINLCVQIGTGVIGLVIGLLTLPMTVGKFVEWVRAFRANRPGRQR